jgi:hypothetical protein
MTKPTLGGGTGLCLCAAVQYRYEGWLNRVFIELYGESTRLISTQVGSRQVRIR